MHGITMKVKCKTVDVIDFLKTNRDKHAKIVEEARKGYVERAQKALTKKLQAIKEGHIVSLHIDLMPPQDYTRTYDTAIKMLDMHMENTIELTAAEVRQFVEDDWGWQENFLISNSTYSASARQMSEVRGYVASEDPEDAELPRP